jgi:hypothetical protein
MMAIAGILLLVKYWEKMPEWVHTALDPIGQWFKKYFWDIPTGWISKLWEYFSGIFNQIGNWFKNLGGNMGSGLKKILGFQTGGIMPYTGLAYLHQGEKITPAGQTTNFTPNVTIYASVSNDMDIRSLADKLSRYWVSDYQRLNIQRGM